MVVNIIKNMGKKEIIKNWLFSKDIRERKKYIQNLKPSINQLLQKYLKFIAYIKYS
jgi:hypothetical protein